MSPRQSAPLYPKYLAPAPERTLAYYDLKHGLFNEQGKLLGKPCDLEELRTSLFQHNLLLFTDSIAGFPHLPALITDSKSEVLCDSKGTPLAVHLRFPRNTTRWIVAATAWNANEQSDFLPLLRTVYEYCAVGCAPTPGSLGQALMRSTWKEHRLQRHTRPHSGCIAFLHEHMTGGRVDTPGGGQIFDRLLELDRKNAYVAEYGKHPTGTAERIGPDYHRGTAEQCFINARYVTWFAHCRISIRDRLHLGPFPVRGEDGCLSYPVEPGTFEASLWREQAEDCIRAGCTVTVLDGWGWTEWTEENQHWCAVVEDLRRRAPTPEIEQIIKQAIVAGIGRHAMSNILYRLVPADRAAPEDEAVAEQGRFYNYYIHQFNDHFHANMLHWNAYTVMQMARALYAKALPYAQMGSLVATNYDAVYLKLWRYEELALPEKGSQRDREAASGTWRYRLLYRNTNNDRPSIGVRSINMQTEDGQPYVRRPGVPS